MPTGTFSQKIHCQEIPSTTAPPTSGPIATAQPGDAGPDAERDATALARDRRAQDRERQRRDDRAPDPLDGSSGDEPLGRRSEGGRSGRAGEDRDTDHEHPLAPEAVAERGAREEEDGEGERVRVDDPLELLDRRAEVDADHGECGRDDEVVEHDHEERDRGDREASRACASRLSSWPPVVLTGLC